MCLGIQTVILERLSPVAAFRRSWRLTYGSFWRIFLFYLVIGVVERHPERHPQRARRADRRRRARRSPSHRSRCWSPGVIDIFTSPFILILLTLVYYDIRIRREAFDIEMLAQSI